MEDKCLLHIPHPGWLASGLIVEVESNWHEFESWSVRFLTTHSCRTCNSALSYSDVLAPPSKCLFYCPDPWAPSTFGRGANWLAAERWANETYRACFCLDCTGVTMTTTWSEGCNLHIPHPHTDDPHEEAENWVELERWVIRLKACFCTVISEG